MTARRRGAAIAVVTLAAIAAMIGARPYARGASLVVRAADVRGWPRSFANLVTQDVGEQDITIPTRYGSIPGREYRPSGHATQVVLLVTGVHAMGVAEPRLVRLARELSASGVAVITPELPGLKRYQLTTRSTDMIEDSGAWLLTRDDLRRVSRPALMGISFSGGLSIVAAGRPSIRDRLSYVFSFGGHADLPRVLQFLARGAGEGTPPHDYGVAILLLNVVTQVPGFVPPDQAPGLLRAIESFLWASRLTVIDDAAAVKEFERARQLGRALPEPSASWMKEINDRDVRALGPKLLPYLAALSDAPALSPERSPAPSAPVLLLHGEDDAVIPSSESRHLAEHLAGKTLVDVLVSPLLIHAETGDRATLSEGWKLIAFWSRLLAR